MKKLLPLLALVLICSACRHDGLPEGVLDAPAMTEFLADAYLLEGFYAIETQYRYDRLTDEVIRYYDSILERHGITREQVERSLDYYTAHPDAYQAIHDSVVVRLEARQAEDIH